MNEKKYKTLFCSAFAKWSATTSYGKDKFLLLIRKNGQSVILIGFNVLKLSTEMEHGLTKSNG